MSRAQLLITFCETRDPSRLQKQLPLLFPGNITGREYTLMFIVQNSYVIPIWLCCPGISRLELGEMHEATALISPMEERMPLVVPVKTREFRGCVEKWMVQVI